MLPAILLVNTVADRQIVACCCERASAAGVQPGMTLAHARALLPGKEKGTKGPRDQGTEGRRDQGTEGRRDQGTKGRKRQVSVSAPWSPGPLAPLSLHPFTPQRDAIALRALAEWATRFAPTVSPDAEMAALVPGSGSHSLGPGPSSLGPAFLLHTGLILDVTGCTRLYGSESKLMQQLTAAVTRLGFRCRAAIAPTIGGAWALSRFGPQPAMIVQDDDLLAALAPLPVRALRVDENVLDALAEVAVDRIEHLLALPREMLPSRFGDDLLLRLDQALGQAMETIDPVRPAPPPSVEVLFAGPATQVEAIQQAARKLVEELVTELRHRESGARQLDLTLFRADAEPVQLNAAFGRPSRDVRHLWSLLSPQLEKANLGHGVDRMTLCASRLGRLRHEQAERWRDNDAATATQLEQELGQLVDVLTNRLGPAGVLEVEAVATHQPTRAFRLREQGAGDRRQETGDRRQGTGDRGQGTERHLAGGLARRGAAGQAGISNGRGPDLRFGISDLRSEISDSRSEISGLRSEISDLRLEHSDSRAGGHGGTALDRPSLLLEIPELIEVWAMTPDGPPVLLRWRGAEHRVVSSVGPLRIADEWWRAGQGTGDREQGAGDREHLAGGLARREAAESLAVGMTAMPIAANAAAAEAPAASATSLAAVACCDYFKVADDTGRWLWISRSWPSGRWLLRGMWV